MQGCSNAAFRGFDRHVPFEDRLAPASEMTLEWADVRARLAGLFSFGRRGEHKPPYPDQFAAVPRMELVRMLYRLLRSQHPRHSPESEEIPPFAGEWLSEFDRGRDVIDWYGSPPS